MDPFTAWNFAGRITIGNAIENQRQALPYEILVDFLI